MFCKQCGAQLKEDAVFCTVCGAKQNTAPIQNDAEKTMYAYEGETQLLVEEPAPAQPAYQAPAQPVYQAPEQPVYQAPAHPAYEPAPVYGGAPVNNTPHNGRVGFGKAIALYFKNYANFKGRASRSEFWWSVLFVGLVNTVASFIPYVGYIISLAFLVPDLAITIRRLHDIGKSWTYVLMGLIPFAGGIILLIKMFKEGEGDNRWGLGANSVAAPVYQAPVYQAPVAPAAPVVQTPVADSISFDRALSEIVPTYTGSENLASAMMLCDPQTIKANIAAADTQLLKVVTEAIDSHIANGEDESILSLVKQNVIETLCARG